MELEFRCNSKTETVLYELYSYHLVLWDLNSKKSRFVLPLKSVSAGKFLAYIDTIAFIKSVHNETEVQTSTRPVDCNTTWIPDNFYGVSPLYNDANSQFDEEQAKNTVYKLSDHIQANKIINYAPFSCGPRGSVDSFTEVNYKFYDRMMSRFSMAKALNSFDYGLPTPGFENVRSSPSVSCEPANYWIIGEPIPERYLDGGTGSGRKNQG